MIRLCYLLVLLTPIAAQADIFKWTDTAGVTHYTDQPPAGAKSVETIHSPAPATGAPTGTATTGPKTAAELEMEFRKRRLDAADAESKQQKEQATQAERKLACASITRRLKALEGGRRIAEYDDKGEIQVLSDDQRREESESLRKQVDASCR